MKELDLTKVLENAPEGLKLYSPIYGDVKLSKGSNDHSIMVKLKIGVRYFETNGKYFKSEDGECMLFPSKTCRDWSKFQCPKVGDLVRLEGDNFTCKVSKLMSDGFRTMRDGKLYCGDVSYLYNFEIVEEPKFKVGDIVIAKNKPCKILGYNNENHYYVCHSPYPCDACVKIEDIRLATEQELRDEYNLMFDENKNLVRWMPKKDELYWYINGYAEPTKTTNQGWALDSKVREASNCFPTRGMAEKAARAICKYLKNFNPNN